MIKTYKQIVWIPFLFLFLFGCAHHPTIPKSVKYTAYAVQKINNNALSNYAPLFFISDTEKTYNKIGTPKARYDNRGNEEIYVDIDDPAVFYMEKSFSTKKGNYTNLIYRIHFSEVPFSIIPFNLTAGGNVGVMIVITIDAKKKPVLVTTVHTCGCYRATIPTTYLPEDAFPEKWNRETIKVYGETLPGILNLEGIDNPALLIYLRPGVHRIMDIQVAEKNMLYRLYPDKINAKLIPVDTLENIPLNGEFTSFYHHDGILNGYVKGSIKPWESIFLSLISLDFFVGTDKIYADTDKTGNRFYTSLKPWNRKKSDMWHFADFLQFWGWRL